MDNTAVAARRIVAFDPWTRRWLTEQNTESIPVVDVAGAFVLPETPGESAGDLGNVVTGAPAAILRPKCAEDIASVVRMCHRFGIPVAARGCHHTTHGQSLAPGGVAIEMTSLNRIHDVVDGFLYAEAGVTWRTVLDHVVALGWRPAGLPGYLDLTLGGTLSVGGICAEHREGGLVDRVVELEIVTGTGELLRCSRTEHGELFASALAGLGQVGIITGVALELLHAPAYALAARLSYIDHRDAVTAMRTLAEREEIDGVLCVVAPPTATTPPTFQVTAHSWFTVVPPNLDGALSRVPRPVTAPEITQRSYVDHVTFYDRTIEDIRRNTTWDVGVKPWFDVFLPDSGVESFVGRVIPELTDEDWSAPMGFVLLHIHRRDSFGCPRLRVPEDTEYVWLFDVLTVSLPGHDRDYTDRMLRRNERLWAEAEARGGVLYPIGSQPPGPDHWQRHYGRTWPEVREAKRRFDPEGILTPGVRMFDCATP